MDLDAALATLVEGTEAYPRLTYTAAWTVVTFLAWAVLRVALGGVEAFSSKPGYAAFNFAHLLPIVALCYYGLIGRLDWVTRQPDSITERMYGFDECAEKICLIQIALQIYVTTAALVTRDKLLLKAELLAHHIVTGTLMYICLHPFGHSRVGVFFGLTEISTLPLNMLDTFKSFKPLAKRYPVTNTLSKIAFAITFLGLRVGLTSQVSIEFQKDLYELYSTGAAHSVPAVAFMSISNIFVVCLQFYWATLIFKGLYKMFTGTDGKKQD